MEVDKLTAEVMRFMLFRAHKHPNIPVKREELTQLITENYKQRNLPSTVISNAQAKLKAIFGLEMVEIQRPRQTKASHGRSASQATTADVKVYVLRSLVSEELTKRFIETPDTAAFSGFALVVIGILQLVGDKVPEEVIWQQLRRLGINEFDNNHPVFGNIKEAFQTLVKQRFIHKEKVSSSDGDTWVMEVAERAQEESFKVKVQEFISKLATGGGAEESTPR